MHDAGQSATSLARAPAPAAAPPLRPVAPLVDRALDASGLGPLAAGCALSALLLAAFFGMEWAVGRVDQLRGGSLPPVVARNMEIGAVIALVLGYFVSARRYAQRWARQALHALRPQLDLSDAAFGRLVAEVGTASAGAARRAGVIGVAVALTAGPIVDQGVAHYFTRVYWSPESLSHWLSIPFVGWLGGTCFLSIGTESGRVSRLADRLKTIDLFDLRPMAPFARYGLRSALLVLLFAAILSLLVPNAGFGPLVALLGAIALALGVRTLLRPVGHVSRRIRAAKQEELDRVRSEIRRDREQLHALGGDAQAAAARLPGLLAFERRIEGVRESPFDVPTLLRFALYLVIPLGSWLGGALVERALTSLLD